MRRPSDSPAFPEFADPLTPVSHPLSRRTPGGDGPRILLARHIAAGDILMTTPLVRALRARWPDAHITYLVEPRMREAIDAHPSVDRLLLWETLYWKRMTRRLLFPLWLARAVRLRKMLEQCRFDIFLSLQPEDNALLPRFVGAPVRVGVFDLFRTYHGAKSTSRLARRYTRAFTYDDLPEHRVDQYLLPLRALDIDAPADTSLTLARTAGDIAAVDEFLRRNALRRFAVVAPQAGWPSRCWPSDRFARAADRFATEKNLGIVVIGSASERAGVDAVRSAMRTPSVDGCGVLGFRAMAELIARADVLLGNDSGPMHVASAVGTPYVALFGSTPVPLLAPRSGRGRVLSHSVPCGPCDRKLCANAGDNHLLCLKKITVDEAVDAVKEIVGAESRPRHLERNLP